ncbi:protein phosphatase 2C domain-containing protein, partial [Pseudoalteromonas sp. RB2-MNA-CIBAN-0110]
AIHSSVDANQGDSVKDFSTTLILAAHKKVEEGYLVISFWIGDGGIAIYDKNKKVVLMGEPDSGEFAGQTRFLDNKIFEDGSVYRRVKMDKV